MNGFTKFSKGICIFSMVCCFVISIVLAATFGKDRYGDADFGIGFLIFLCSVLGTLVVHSFWGMLISMAEDIHDILYYTENYAQRNYGNPTAQSESSEEYHPTDFQGYSATTALRKLQNINYGGSTDARSVSTVSTPQSAPVSQAQPEAPLTPWTCRNCGENNSGDAKFCSHCGLFR